MNKELLEKYVDLIMSMSISFKMGSIDKETYLINLELMLKAMKDEQVLQ